MKKLKKSVSLLLTLVMLFSCCSLFSSAAQADDYDHYPQIFATGIASATIYYEDDPEKKSLFYPVDTERIIGNLGNIPQYLLTAVKKKNPDLLYEVVYGFLMDAIGMLGMGTDGSTSCEGVVVDPLALAYDGDGKYTFYFDSRLSPLESADQLYTYIQWVKEDSGYDKVELTGSSFGSIIVATYLYKYADHLDDIDSVLMVGSPVKGVPFIGEILSGEFHINSKNLKEFVDRKLGTEGIGLVLEALNNAGVLQPLIDATVIPALNEAIMDAVLDFARDSIATMPSLWSAVPAEYLDSALANIFGENYDDPNHEYAVLIDKIQLQNSDVTARVEEVLTQTMENYKDIHMCLFAKCGSPALPIGEADGYEDDGFVTLATASYGATSAKFAKQLPADYKQALHTEYNLMSPDRKIDASTGLLPFTTWYLKGLGHMQKNTEYYDLFNDVIYNNLDVFSDPKWPQFLQVDEEDPEKLVPVPEAEYEAEGSFPEKVIAYIINLFKTLIEKVTGAFKK